MQTLFFYILTENGTNLQARLFLTKSYPGMINFLQDFCELSHAPSNASFSKSGGLFLSVEQSSPE